MNQVNKVLVWFWVGEGSMVVVVLGWEEGATTTGVDVTERGGCGHSAAVAGLATY